jgi:hypothetical protein
LLLARVARADALELVEQLGQVVRRDPDTRVDHGDLHLLVSMDVDARRDPAALRRDLDRVAEQVEDDLLRSDGVLVHRRDPPVDLEREFLRLVRRERGDDPMDTAYGVFEVEVLRRQLHLARLDLRQVEDLVDQLKLELARRDDVSHVLVLLLVERAEDLGLQDLGEADDREDQPYNFLYQTNTVYIVSERVHGIVPGPYVPAPDTHLWWLAPEKK